jgi:DNA ligase-1
MKNVIKAVDVDLDNLDAVPYPVAVLCKKDGVRALVREGDDNVIRCYARTNKPHRNPHIQMLFARAEYLGFDSEGIVGDDNDPLVSYKTSGGFSRSKDTPKEGKFMKVDASLHVFDLIDHPGDFEERHAAATERVGKLLAIDINLPIQMIPYEIAHCAADIERIEAKFLADGYEGFILRKLKGLYKNGTTTQKEGTYLRGKRFVERELLVTRIEEGQINGNEAKKNERGQTERSSHKENMIPNGMVGAIYGYDVIDGVVGTEEKCVSPGKMTDEMAKYYWENPTEIVQHYITYKFFPIGNKDKPRFPTYQRHRAKEDM